MLTPSRQAPCLRFALRHFAALLSNLYLQWFDTLFHRADGPAQWAGAKLVRYADDAVPARYQGSRLRRRSQRPFRPPEGVGYYGQIQRFGLVRL